ncbi:MAG: tRNA pseudouridine(55) synthase TruB [Desulfurella sp.]|jgi:tRNA pseudouridine55 synthase|uniref:tRNA pseudouridine synthase B n=1 Tax=Desulfurella multipotens TaxID=79269 RepID=A0A1G6LR08_9BACT|nr:MULTISPECIES: tRNA pseudouridine(55) synthase TruB [Desulfurella]AHF97031.1 tRNA pseudouridine synthase B [Desulfurella acetivorans A63]PMP65251.1 MAG: tRNA pseudouridine(55) synthase TruB [Desulfurella multipotens]PMP92916.1 MAG: tRNA pseudouridine(55) synthase TruB [Desulfurella sp.]SDC45527.1 tRNA pseudouridine55 synthase [Desulfurella multipotens]
MNGILLIDKPSGITSFDVVKKIKKIFNVKVGHSGTLDKFACGLMVIGIGKATKLLSFFEKSYKVYKAKITFGFETDTLDITGNIVYQNNKIPNLDDILKTITQNFIGKIEQIVPIYSNVKVYGKRLYKYALSNQHVVLPKKTVYISSIDILNYNNGVLEIKITCSKGTYIRALARDIARSINSYATVTYLERLYIFPFSIKDAVELCCVSQNHIIPIEKVKYITKIDMLEVSNGIAN